MVERRKPTRFDLRNAWRSETANMTPPQERKPTQIGARAALDRQEKLARRLFDKALGRPSRKRSRFIHDIEVALRKSSDDPIKKIQYLRENSLIPKAKVNFWNAETLQLYMVYVSTGRFGFSREARERAVRRFAGQ